MFIYSFMSISCGLFYTNLPCYCLPHFDHCSVLRRSFLATFTVRRGARPVPEIVVIVATGRDETWQDRMLGPQMSPQYLEVAGPLWLIYLAAKKWYACFVLFCFSRLPVFLEFWNLHRDVPNCMLFFLKSKMQIVSLFSDYKSNKCSVFWSFLSTIYLPLATLITNKTKLTKHPSQFILFPFL